MQTLRISSLPAGQHLDEIFSYGEQSVPAASPPVRQARGRSTRGNHNAEGPLGGAKPQVEVTNQLHDHRAPQAVVGAQLDPAHDRQPTGVERRVVGIQRFKVLAVARPHHPDDVTHEADEIRSRRA